MKHQFLSRVIALACALAVIVAAAIPASEAAAGPRSAPAAQALDPTPPDHPVKLIFIHHSTGGNWLASPSENELGGDLGRALMENNYFASATNYGWGPDSIGDATDIPNWLDWFRGPSSDTYLRALYAESGQNFGDFGAWPRLASDPGGENEIIVFKSCFPNSDLEGNPDDPPDPEGWLSVGHAKYVYNEILKYFATRPDKLFIVIAAPPLSPGSTTRAHAANARAFNEWLVNDWLGENNYLPSNVAVFDFYNVLTGPDAHHRYANGQIEHLTGSRDTLYYPSGDDHPSLAGNRKATEEFIPLLNIFYHRWQATTALTPVASAAPPLGGETQVPVAPPPPSGTVGALDDFEAGPPAGTSGWEAYFQDGSDTRLDCAPDSSLAHGGRLALKFAFDVTANSWATCGFYFDSVQDWRVGEGISFYLRADQAGLPFDVDLYGGSPAARTMYIYSMQASPASTDDWVLVKIRWDEILRAAWEENAGAPFDPAAVTGFSLGLGSPEQSRLSGTIWVDDLQLIEPSTAVTEAPQVAPTATEQEQPQTEEGGGGGGGLPCAGSLLLPLAFIGLALLLRRK